MDFSLSAINQCNPAKGNCSLKLRLMRFILSTKFLAINEDGLGMAGLNFPGNAYYSDALENDKDNITPFEFIPTPINDL